MLSRESSPTTTWKTTVSFNSYWQHVNIGSVIFESKYYDGWRPRHAGVTLICFFLKNAIYTKIRQTCGFLTTDSKTRPTGSLGRDISACIFLVSSQDSRRQTQCWFTIIGTLQMTIQSNLFKIICEHHCLHSKRHLSEFLKIIFKNKLTQIIINRQNLPKNQRRIFAKRFTKHMSALKKQMRLFT